MARVTTAEVQQILPPNLVPAAQDLSPFIIAADNLVQAQCATQPYTATELKEIERWLAAHFVMLQNPQYMSERLGDEGYTRALQVGFGISMTSFGQSALTLDYLGGLARIDYHVSRGKRAKATINHLGSRRYDYHSGIGSRGFRGIW
jgi:hypothetical protein